jgi:hypothetical protein
MAKDQEDENTEDKVSRWPCLFRMGGNILLLLKFHKDDCDLCSRECHREEKLYTIHPLQVFTNTEVS